MGNPQMGVNNCINWYKFWHKFDWCIVSGTFIYKQEGFDKNNQNNPKYVTAVTTIKKIPSAMH